MAVTPGTTQVSLQTFLTITATDGTYSTWAEILELARTTLPVNPKILNAVIKDFKNVTGGTVVFKNGQKKNVQVFRDSLDRNNVMSEDKHTMFIKNYFMLPFEYSSLDIHSASEWSEMLADDLAQMFISKKDILNNLALNEIFKVAIATGSVKIIKKLGTDMLQTPTTGDVKFAYLQIGQYLANTFKKQTKLRTKFSTGTSERSYKWLLSNEASANLLAGKSYGTASDKAYADLTNKNEVNELFGSIYETNINLQTRFGMSEFETIKEGVSIPANTPYLNETSTAITTTLKQVVYAGQGTGNLLYPMNFENLIGLMFYIDSLEVAGNEITADYTQPAVNSRTNSVISNIWRYQAAIKPIFSKFNIAILNDIPKREAYLDFETGDFVPGEDYSKIEDFTKLVNRLKQEQPDIYGKILKNVPTTQEALTKMWKEAEVLWPVSPTATITQPTSRK